MCETLVPAAFMMYELAHDKTSHVKTWRKDEDEAW